MFSPLILLYSPNNEDPFELSEPFTWWSHALPDGRHVVPRGRTTDLASIPFGMRNFFDRLGPSVRAAIIHDDLYRRRYFTRSECDRLFYVALLECGVPKWKAKLYHRGVRLGGGIAVGDNW